MAFNQETWREELRKRLQGWKGRMTRAGVKSVYAFLSAATLWPVAQAAQQGDWAALMALGGVLGGVGSNLIANQIQQWKDETDGAKRLEGEVGTNAELRQALDTLLEKLAVVEEAARGLSEADRAWFQEVLRQEVAQLGSRIHVEDSTAAVGSPGAKVVDERGVLIEGDVKGSVIVTGDDNKLQLGIGDDTRPDVEALKHAYLNWVVQRTRLVPLEAVDPRAAADPDAKLYLNAVYTALLTLTPEAHERLMREEMALREARRRSALEELNAHSRLVLLGDPGSGKTTFVNFVALCLAGELLGREDANLALLTAPLPDEDGDDRKERQPWDHGALLPVRVVLRDFAARGLPKPGERATVEHLWTFLAEELKQDGLQDFVPHLRKHMLEKGGIFLFDGLDEVPEAERRRDQILQVIHGVATTFFKSRVLVTSRVYAYRRQDWTLNDFSVSVLAPFSRGQIIRFVDRWYEHTAHLRQQSPEDARGRASLFKQRVLNNERLYKLAERPLLLTLMASLHAWRGGSLPEKREQLYEDMVDLLLDWWERQRVVRDERGREILQSPSLSEFLKVGKDRILRALAELAYEAHAAQPDTRGTADIPRKELVARLMAISENPDVRPKRLEEYLRDRAGVLIERGVGVYAFPHRSFQEYLAAWHLTEKGYPDQVAALARRDPERWREVALLAGAKAGRGASYAMWALVDKLIQEEPPEKPEEATSEALWGAHLAGQLLAENIESVDLEAEEKRLKPIRRWLVLVMRHHGWAPSERVLAGNNLAKLGDSREEVLDPLRIEWIEIPAGPFIMGEGEGQYTHDIPYTYWISRYPITNAQFQVFVDAGGYEKPQYWREAKQIGVWGNGRVKGWMDEEPRVGPVDFGEPYNLPNHPVVGITWYEALAFTQWLTERLREDGQLPEGYAAQLPNEPEWEKAARGDSGLIYPWGNKPDPNHANYDETGIGSTSAVGCFPRGASPYGVEEMSGNVWEWTRSLWGENPFRPEFEYPYDLADGRENLNAPSSVLRVLRGGAFDINRWDVRCSFRGWNIPSSRVRNVGFRVVVSPFATES